MRMVGKEALVDRAAREGRRKGDGTHRASSTGSSDSRDSDLRNSRSYLCLKVGEQGGGGVGAMLASDVPRKEGCSQVGSVKVHLRLVREGGGADPLCLNITDAVHRCPVMNEGGDVLDGGWRKDRGWVDE